jgi:integrase
MYKHLLPPDAKHSSYRGRFRIGDNPKVHEVTLRTTVKEVAEKLLTEKYEDAQRESVGLIPAAFTRRAMRRPLVELVEEYLKDVEKRSLSRSYTRMLKPRILALAKDCRWTCTADVTRKGFVDWRNRKRGFEARTFNHFFDAARAFFNWVDRTYEIPNPLKRVEKLPVVVKYPQGPRAFSEEELKKLLAAAPQRRRFVYFVLAFSGLRRKEARMLLWGDVHLDDEPGFFLRAEATKARRADWLPILSVLLPELRAARSEFFKPSTRVFWRGVPDADTLHRDMTKAGIPLVDKWGRPTGIHTFRRTFISHLQRLGVPARVIMQLARHKSLRLTDWTYTDTTKLPLAEGIETLAGMAKVVSSVPAPPQSSPPKTRGGKSSPLTSPLKSGQNGDFQAKAVPDEKSGPIVSVAEVAESERDCPALSETV